MKVSKKALAGGCARLNLPHYAHIALRRMFITRAIEKGIDVKVIRTEREPFAMVRFDARARKMRFA